MPIYEYRCEKCGDFEEMQRITDPPLARCPKCKGKVRRLISSTSFQLKGSGWYATDYGRTGAGNGGKKDTVEKAEKAEKAEKKDVAEAKPASDSKSGGETKPTAASDSSEKPAS
jgi:putative FmdB family regulatory protein